MSNALAIAAVTRVLKDLLNNGLIDNNVSDATGNVRVTALPPDRVVPPGGADASQLNLFLHQVTYNASWRNVELPSRNARGDWVQNTVLPLNLHYLLTAYGAEELHSEILLGYAMQLLHENPVLDRQAIRNTLAGSAVNGSILPQAFQAVAASDLAEQVEMIKITPQQFNNEDMSKLWTALQTHYRSSVAYEVSVVLIESRRPTRSALPVLTRGQGDPATGRDEGVKVQADMLAPFPTLQSLTPEHEQIAARLGEMVTLEGHHLAGDEVFVCFLEPRSRRMLQLPAQSGATDTKLKVELPPDPPPGPVTQDSPDNPDNWRAGVYTVTVLIQRTGEADRSSNELPLMLAPRITNVQAAANPAGDLTFTVNCSPKAGPTQRVSLIVGDREIPIVPFGTQPTDTLTFNATGFKSGSHPWVRLRVDGADSILVDRNAKPPAFVASQHVTIP
jgi:hypothetical protein